MADREWGYTALSRHRETSTFYITTPPGFLNQPALPELDSDLADRATELLDERRRQLALELAKADHTPTPDELHALLSDLTEIRAIPNPADEIGLEPDLDPGWDLGHEAPGSMGSMAASVEFTIAFDEPDEAGWIVARVLEVPGAMSQGRTRDEARENVLDALRIVLTPDEELAGGQTTADLEHLRFVAA
ncbi:MAG: HicB like antitoxin of bacterial toxin-antitoxin system [Thermoleophilales bacterium]|jgi:predicted RNase H-like HicB family nuclease|nr:HicB like antitoxin of bacterial toxin-antitoxin system [Thermoleophilales bacterium]